MDEDERRRRAAEAYDPAGGSPSAAATPGAAPAPGGGGSGGGQDRAPGSQRGTGFVNLQTYLGANYAAGQDMAQHVAGETARQGDAERSALQSLQVHGTGGGAPQDPSLGGAGVWNAVPEDLAARAQSTASRATLAGPGGGGLSTVLAQDYGQQSPYTSGMGGFDAFLAGQAGGKTLQASANNYGQLGNQVNAINTQAAKGIPSYPVAPAAPAAPTAPGGGAYPVAPPARRPGASSPLAPTTTAPEMGEPRGRNDPRRKAPNPWWQG